MTIRGVLLAAVAAFCVHKLLVTQRLASPLAMERRPVYSEIDDENDSLQHKHGKLKKIYERVPEGAERIVKGPETVVFGNDGTMYVLTEEAKLVKLNDFGNVNETTIIAKATEVMHLGVGRPLGAKFAADGTLYIADAHLGLTRVPPHGTHVELVASRVRNSDGHWTPILYANDVAIGRKTGMVYFTDYIAPDRIGTRMWDTMYMAKLDFLRGKPTGRLLQYNPKTNEVTILATGLWFANGIGVDKDESFLLLSETFAQRSLKYPLKGPNKGSLEVVADKFTGYPDGADCSFVTGVCYAPMPSATLPLMKKIYKLPHPIDVVIRSLLMLLPHTMAPKVVPYGGIVEISPNGNVDVLQDPEGSDIGMLTGVTVHDEKLYLGSLQNEFIGVYDLRK